MNASARAARDGGCEGEHIRDVCSYAGTAETRGAAHGVL
jgi:hypothetical protein